MRPVGGGARMGAPRREGGCTVAHGSISRRPVAFGLLVVALVGASIGGSVAVISWSPWEGSSAPQVVDVTQAPEPPAPSLRRPEKRLTATEASELAERYISDHRDSFYSGGSIQSVRCGKSTGPRGETTGSPEYNDATNQWIIPCEYSFLETGLSPDKTTYGHSGHFRVDAETGAFSRIR